MDVESYRVFTNTTHSSALGGAYGMLKQMYLGDGAYAEWNGSELILYTTDGIQRTNEVVLGECEISVLKLFLHKMEVEVRP